MLVRVVVDSVGTDVVVSVHDPRATVAQLVTALLPGWRGRSVLVDGRRIRAGQPLDRAGIGDGAELRPEGLDPVPALGAGTSGEARPVPVTGYRKDVVAELLVIDGADTGRRFSLSQGRYVVGRTHDAPDADLGPAICEIDDPTVSRHHLDVVVGPDGTLTVTDAGSTNGTEIAGRPIGRTPVTLDPRVVLRCGATRLRATSKPMAIDSIGTEAVGDDAPLPRPARGAHTVPLHRHPRPPRPLEDPPVPLPEAPAPPPAVTPVGLLAVAASVILGAVLVILLHSWTYAAFAVLGPVLMVANAVDSRRRRRRVRRSGARQRRRDLVALDTELTGRHEAERARRHHLHPGAGAAVAQVRSAPTTCWQRRTDDDDAFAVELGHGTVVWDPPLAGGPPSWPDDVAAVADRHRRLDEASVGCRLEPGAALAIVGPHSAALALARALMIQVAVEHGPADLRVAVLAAGDHGGEWDWAAWLPQARDPGGEALLAAGPVAGESVAAAVSQAGDDEGERGAPPPPGPRTVIVIDDPSQLVARRSPVRTVLRSAADPALGLVPIVVVEHRDDVPALCRLVITVTSEGGLGPSPGLTDGPATFTGLSTTVAAEVARRLARFDDPDREDADRNLPSTVALGDLVGFDIASPRAVAARWRAAGSDPAIEATIGAAEDGPLIVDLAADGPHALVAGTTGSGKSELLRTLVASLALGASPDHLTFVLIDFKGGSAFDACARLPHVTGVVTDLDDHLAARALRCLEAELRNRERRLREVGAEDLTAWRRAAPPTAEPLPRLVVVIDEFATLAAELGGFVDALVGVAQRGRSLGVHLVLATQRPSGSVSDHIRANTNLRVALRVQDGADSRDVLDRPDAASIPRSRPGRAVARLGPGELVNFQTAQVTALSHGDHDGGGRLPVTVVPLGIGGIRSRAPARACDVPGHQPAPRAGPTELEQLVDAAVVAWCSNGGRTPRPAWPEPLPTSIDAATLAPIAGSPTGGDADLVVGLADDPDHQRHVPFAWHLDEGPLLAIGLPGSGTTTLAATVVTAAARRWPSDQLHVHAVDLGAGGLSRLEALPQVGAVLGATDDERQRRLITDLRADLAHRQAHGRDGRPRRLLVVDGLGAFRARWDDVEPNGTWAGFVDLLARGTSVAIHVLVTADSSGPVPHHVLGACRQRLLFRLADRGDHAAYGVAAHEVPDLGPGRAVAAEGPAVVQIALPTDPGPAPSGPTNSSVVAKRRPTVPWSASDPSATGDHRIPTTVPILPDEVALDSLRAPWVETDADGSVSLSLGVDDASLDVARLLLAPGGHALVAGPPRSGRTTTLRTLAAVAAGAGVGVVAVTSHPRQWSPLAGLLVRSADDEDLALHLERLTAHGPLLVIVDDADRIDDDHPVLAILAHARRPDRHIIAAGRVDRLRARYGHWTRELQADRTGLLLQPDPDLDGDLLGVRLPRRLGPTRPGRGWLATEGPGGLIQVAHPTAHEADP